MIIGRKQEINILNTILEHQDARFLAVWGRRRVGKTFLVRQFFTKKGDFFELIGQKNSSRADQLANFASNYSALYLNNSAIPKPSTWSEAFTVLTKKLQSSNSERKQILFFDELPWLGQECLEALDYAWNDHWSKLNNLILIVCGSAASWMLRKIINAKGGLYNRLTDVLHLQAFDFLETKQFLESRKIKYPLFDLVELYLATGGIPHYLDLLKRDLSVAQNIEQLMFGKNAALKDEYNRLFEALFDNSSKHYSVMKVLNKSRTGLNRNTLVQSCKIAESTLHEVLLELEASGFIKSYVPFGYKKRESFYRIIDQYSLFYLKWIEPQKDRSISKNYWVKTQQDSSWAAWAGYSFEWFCEAHSEYLLRALGINGINSVISKWKFKGDEQKQLNGAEIDLIIDRADSMINICEVKFTRKPFILNKKYAQTLKERMAIFEHITKTKKATQAILISASGAIDNLHLKESFQKVISLEDLFG
jgi:AAA+ ATPase superfamily predicted ATPase